MLFGHRKPSLDNGLDNFQNHAVIYEEWLKIVFGQSKISLNCASKFLNNHLRIETL